MSRKEQLQAPYRRFYSTPQGLTIKLPVSLSRRLDPDQVYLIELTEEGILFRPVDYPSPEEKPSWLK